MKIGVFGSGGIGGYFGGRLAGAGEEVVFIARGAHLEALCRDGLKIHSIAGDFHQPTVAATADPAEAGTMDLVLVATKAWQLPEAAEAMRPMVGEDTAVLPLLNGVEAPDQLNAVLGEGRALGGVARIMSFIEAPGVIRHAGVDPEIVFGELDRSDTERARAVDELLNRPVGMRALRSREIRTEMWRKLMMMAAGSSVGAVTRTPFGPLREIPEARALIRGVLEEVAMVAAAAGAPQSDDQVERVFGFIDGLPPESTTSMQRDILERRPSELEAQLGVVVRIGSETGVETPVARVLYAALLPQELQARGHIGW